MILTISLISNSVIFPVHADEVVLNNSQSLITKSKTIEIASPNEFPKTIEEGQVYTLANDITLGPDQQIENLNGILDGKGHTITLANKPLAENVSGTIQNLGVTSTDTIVVNNTSGSMAVTLTGTIQNSYSTASIKQDGWIGEPGGLVGILNGGSIKNSYFAGKVESFLFGGLVGENRSSNSLISNCYYTVNTFGPISMGGSSTNIVNCDKKTENELKSSEGISLLNKDIIDTGFVWTSSNNGLPVLKEGKLNPPSGTVDKTSLENYINQAKELESNKDKYTEQSFSTLQQALKDSLVIFEKENATQTEVDEQSKKLSDSINALEKKKPTSPVAHPEDKESIQHISSVDDLKKIDISDENAFYVLDNDIVINSTDNYFPYGDFQGVLDGQGHTVTFNNSNSGIFHNIGSSGVLQNIYFTGTSNRWDTIGPAGIEFKGSIINSYSDVSGSYVCGFAKRMNGGILSNSYSTSQGGKGVLFNQYSSGNIINTYWQKHLVNPITIPENNLINSSSKSEDEIKSLEFVELLNTNRGEYGTKWGQNNNGYPYFGENQGFNPEKPDFSNNKYKVIFESYNGESMELDKQLLHLSPDFVEPTFKLAGKFKLSDVPKGSKIEWASSNVEPKNSISIGSDDGALRIDAQGTAIITATEIKENGDIEKVATIKVVAESKNIEKIKLSIDGHDVTNGKYTIDGSEWKSIKVEAKYEGSNEYVPVTYSRFTYTANDTDMIYNTTSSSSFYFKKPGTASIKVASIADSSINATVELTSKYVPVQSIELTVPDSIEIHSRNANSEKFGAFIPDYSGVIVKPENASNRDNYTIESSDPTVGEFVTSMVYGYVPYKTGTTTYKAVLTDVNPDTNEKNEVTNSKKVTYTYKNPLTNITVGNKSIEVNNNTSTKLDLTFNGERSYEGYSVTEPEIIWTYDKKGIVEIEREATGFWKKNTEEYDKAPDKGDYLPITDYYVTALSEGTVTVTGTPADKTNNVSPITFKITVKPGDAKPVDISDLMLKGTNGAINYINENYKNGYSYGNEWVVFDLLRAGESISQDKLDAYYESVVKEVKSWSHREKPTNIERVSLALSIIGKDITNVDGINLAEMIYNHTRLDYGSNELAFALIALDARNTYIPDTALWTREKMIAELLKFQNPKTGGFGLADNETTSVDMTAMVLQAIAKYKDSNEEVNKAIEKALDYLKNNMSSKYDFGTPEGTAQVLIALSALGIDPLSEDEGFGTSYKNIITRLMDYYDQETGGFTRTPGDKKPTEMTAVQVLQGFNSYQRYVNGESSYWDLTDKPQGNNSTGNNNGNGSDGNSSIENNNGNGTGSNSSIGDNNENGTGNDYNVDIESSEVKTGDESLIGVWLFIFMLSSVCLYVSLTRKKHIDIK